MPWRVPYRLLRHGIRTDLRGVLRLEPGRKIGVLQLSGGDPYEARALVGRIARRLDIVRGKRPRHGALSTLDEIHNLPAAPLHHGFRRRIGTLYHGNIHRRAIEMRHSRQIACPHEYDGAQDDGSPAAFHEFEAA